MKTNLEIKNMDVNLILPNKSLVKNYLPDKLSISVKENEITNFDLGKAIEMQLKEKRIMEIIGRKDYEFINKDNQLYLVAKKDIIKEGEMILSINFENAEKIGVENMIEIGGKIINNKEIENYLNITPKLKETYLKNTYDYIQYNKSIKKD
jgi:hypothetical protein